MVDQLISDCNLEEFLLPDDSVQMDMPFTNFSVITESFSGQSKFLTPSQVNVYTDGSKFKGKVGSGVLVTAGRQTLAEMSFRLPDKASVFQAEIFAINQAAIFLQNSTRSSYIKFFVDSQAALMALNNKNVTSRLVGDTMHNLNLVPGLIRLVWIKAHVGHKGNERADGLAKAGTSVPSISHLSLPRQATKFAIKAAIDEIWTFQWQSYNDGRQSKQFYKQPNRKKAKYSYNLSRQELGRLIRITTGHNNLLYHRSNVDKTRNTASLCRFCGEENETFYHFATKCPCFRLSRFHYFQSDSCFTNEQWSIRRLLDFSNIPSISAALGGNFDPILHLEQQRDFEDLIEAEQVDANLQPGRLHDPDNPDHLISTSEDEDNSMQESSQYLLARAHLLHAQQIHNISSSSDSEDIPVQSRNSSTLSATPRHNSPFHTDNDARSPLGADAASTVVESVAPRERLNYDTLELTDDEYLINDTDDSQTDI